MEAVERNAAQRYIAFLLRHRLLVLTAILLVTVFMGYKTYRLRIATDFVSFYPPRHPYIQLYNQYRHMFGSANVLVCAVEVKEGDIYNWETLEKVERITEEMLTIKGSNPTQLISLAHPKVKNVSVSSAMGIKMDPVMHRGVPRDGAGLKEIKQSVYTNEGIRGLFVSPDDRTAAIFAGFWEEGVNPRDLYARLMEIKSKEEDGNHRIHFTGYPALYAYIYHLTPQIRNALGMTVLLLFALLYYYFRSWQGVVFPAISGGMSAVWGLGFASIMGFALDPLVLCIPLIITARALSHSVQCLARYHEEYVRIRDRQEAIVRGYGELVMPAAASILTDAVGLLLISVATIPLMRHVGYFGAFWVMTMVVTVPTLTPVLLSFVGPPAESKLRRESRGRIYSLVARALVRPSTGWGRWVMVGLMGVVLIVGLYYGRQLKVGDTTAGAAVLFPDHPYNQSFRFFNNNFVGASQLVIIVEGKEPGAVKNYETLRAMEDFQRYMEQEGGAGGTLTFTNMIKRLYRMFHEGNPKWESLPKNPRHLGQIGALLRDNAAPGEMDQWVDAEWTNATITCFYKDYDNELIKRAIGKAKEFIDAHPSEKVNFRLAGGLLGILAAVNEEVEYSYWVSLIVVFAACFAICSVCFRSLAAAFILIVPLAISQVLAEALMLIKGIDLNINSLPVAAIAVGIGIDYGIYLLARISEEYRASGDYVKANMEAMETTGKAIAFTATTVIAGVVFWLFVDLKFQAEMGLLLGFLMLMNMVNSMVFIPSLVTTVKPKFLLEKRL